MISFSFYLSENSMFFLHQILFTDHIVMVSSQFTVRLFLSVTFYDHSFQFFDTVCQILVKFCKRKSKTYIAAV